MMSDEEIAELLGRELARLVDALEAIADDEPIAPVADAIEAMSRDHVNCLLLGAVMALREAREQAR